MKVGTRTILFGVHQFLWHPFIIWRAWRWLYGKNPTWPELVAIFCHDLGYWGKPNLDGPEGSTHPRAGAKIAARIVFHVTYRLKFLKFWLNPRTRAEARGAAVHFSVHSMLDAATECLGHSREYAKTIGVTPGKLCWADKACVFFDPDWFYLFRARLAGELTEFKQNAEPYIGKVSDEEWVEWYRGRVMSVLARELPGELSRALHRWPASRWEINCGRNEQTAVKRVPATTDAGRAR